MQSSSRCPKVIPSVACVKHLRQIVASTRSFSTTSRRDIRVPTRARRQFFAWLNTRGLNYRQPLPDSTNYMGAYTKNGELKRVVAAKREQKRQERDKEEAEAAGQPYVAPEPENRHKETPDGPAPTSLSKWKAAKEAKQLAEKSGEMAQKTDMTADGIGGSKAFTPLRLVKGQDERTPNPADEARPADEALPLERPSDLVPFPNNPFFKSEPVLSDKFRQKIWEAIMIDGQTVREASARFNVEMSRVGAIVRLLEVQKEWEKLKKPLATPYAKAVMAMLPKTLYLEDQPDLDHPIPRPHESINDLPVHRATGQQIFHPTSESRVFTRQDAAKVFHEQLLPADDRVPHPELAILHKETLQRLPPHVRGQRAAERQKIEDAKAQLAAETKAKKEAGIKRVDIGKFEYRFTNISVESAGKDGRGRNGTGWRYGAPHMDRKKGSVRIPTTVG